MNWWCQCLYSSAVETETESLCCSEFHQCHFLIQEITESAKGAVCVTQHPGFGPHMDRGMLETD